MASTTPGVYNVHLPIMLESERQAVYRERKKESMLDPIFYLSSTSYIVCR